MTGRCTICGFFILDLRFAKLGLRCTGCLSTQVHRAMAMAIAALAIPPEAKVHELSSKGALVRHLRKTFANSSFSEYFPELRSGEYRQGVRCEDVQALSFADGAFSLVTSTEVFEHVPNDHRGFREVARVLAPGGYFVFTVPIRPGAVTVVRAVRNQDGTITHLLPPEYHDDRILGRGKVLSFRTYGGDIIETLQEAGLQARIDILNQPESAVVRQPVVVCQKIP